MQIYCDMDGVLADFDLGFERVMGYALPPRSLRTENLDWATLRARAPTFFRDLPLMPGAQKLWDYIRPHGAKILTGVPAEVDASANDKIDWALETLLVPSNRTVCCRASQKFLHCHPGDILIDDWEKYRPLWERAGGLWITHTSAESTIQQLKELGL